ncbi:MAG: ComF family protein [Candidatus Omnitrophica bacterium]|nr:ComF family protein [Candidatus Omnitrophota bacterium]
MFKGLGKAFWNTFFPSVCFSCGCKIKEGCLCPACCGSLKFLYPPLCRFCAKPVGDNKSGLCSGCRSKTFSYERLISILSYEEPLITLIHLFKYKMHDYLKFFLSGLIVAHLEKTGISLKTHDCITAVPMHPLKQKAREYNHSALLGKLLANHFQIPFQDDIIYEAKLKTSQAALDKSKRYENVQEAFKAKEAARDKKIAIVDDIFTTGATINSCAAALKEKGASIITVITLCKTPVQ